MAYCRQCGAELPANAAACEYCGSLIEPFSPPDGRGLAGEAIRFKRSSVLGMLFCTVLTMGLYPGIWYILRFRSLRKLDPALYRKARWFIAGFIITHVLYVCSKYDAFSAARDTRELLFYGWLIFWICASFAVRGLLRRCAERVSPGHPINAFIAASELCMILFGFFYLQTQINKMIDARLLEASL